MKYFLTKSFDTAEELAAFVRKDNIYQECIVSINYREKYHIYDIFYWNYLSEGEEINEDGEIIDSEELKWY